MITSGRIFVLIIIIAFAYTGYQHYYGKKNPNGPKFVNSILNIFRSDDVNYNDPVSIQKEIDKKQQQIEEIDNYLNSVDNHSPEVEEPKPNKKEAETQKLKLKLEIIDLRARLADFEKQP